MSVYQNGPPSFQLAVHNAKIYSYFLFRHFALSTLLINSWCASTLFLCSGSLTHRACDEIFMITYSAMPLLLFAPSSFFVCFFCLSWSCELWVNVYLYKVSCIEAMKKNRKRKHCTICLCWIVTFCVSRVRAKCSICVCVCVWKWNGEGQFAKQYAFICGAIIMSPLWMLFNSKMCMCASLICHNLKRGFFLLVARERIVGLRVQRSW